MRTVLALVLSLALVAVPLSANVVDEAVTRRYHEVIRKAQVHTLRSADLKELVVAVDLRNREAASRGVDRQIEDNLRLHRAEIAAHVVTPAEAWAIHQAHPAISEQEILATNTRDRGRDIDEFLAAGGVRHAWHQELKLLTQQSDRYAQLEFPSFKHAAFYVEPDTWNYDGFYGADPGIFIEKSYCNMLLTWGALMSIGCRLGNPILCGLDAGILLVGAACSWIAG